MMMLAQSCNAFGPLWTVLNLSSAPPDRSNRISDYASGTSRIRSDKRAM